MIQRRKGGKEGTNEMEKGKQEVEKVEELFSLKNPASVLLPYLDSVCT